MKYIRDATVAMFDLGMLADKTEEDKSKALEMVFQSLPAHDLGNRFLVICKNAHVKDIMTIAKSYKHFNYESQWVFLVTDTDSLSFDMSDYISMAEDGYNLGFVYNTSISKAGSVCPSGLECLIDSSITYLAKSYEQVLAKELEIFDQVSIEEWEIIMPTLAERSAAALEAIKEMIMATGGLCSNCTSWMMDAVEVRESDRVNQLEVGSWSALMGLYLKDDLLPHVTGGFRGRAIVVASIEYSPWSIYERDARLV